MSEVRNMLIIVFAFVFCVFFVGTCAHCGPSGTGDGARPPWACEECDCE